MDSIGVILRKKISFLLIWILMSGIMPNWLLTEAMKASPHPFVVEQDDEELRLKIKGDELQHWVTDDEDYTVVRDDKGYYMYAKLSPDEKSLVSSGEKVGVASTKSSKKQKDLRPPVREHLSRAKDEILLTGRPAVTSVNKLGRRDRCEKGSKRGCDKRIGNRKSQKDISIISETVDDHHRRTIETGHQTLKNLVILLKFEDHKDRPVPSKEDIEVLMNNEVAGDNRAPTGSLKMKYWENSYGMLTIESNVTDWILLDRPEKYYANGESGLGSDKSFHEALIYALDELESGQFDFEYFDDDNNKNIDCISFLTSGYGAEWGGDDYEDRIWSHKWSINRGWRSQRTGVRVTDYYVSPSLWGTRGNQIGRVGVIAHEIGHYLDLPDLYDTDSSGGHGLGFFDMMANSWGYDGSQLYPPHMSGWSKMQLGWTEPQTPSIWVENYVARSEGKQTSNRLFKIGDDDFGFPPGEYLLIEFRKTEWLIGGIAIYHIDEKTDGYNDEGFPGQRAWPSNGNHYKVALLPADGNFDLEKGVNQGNSADLYSIGQSLSPSIDITGPFPNTDSYQKGAIVQTGVGICITSDTEGEEMTFLFSDGKANATWMPRLAENFDNPSIEVFSDAKVVKNEKCQNSTDSATRKCAAIRKPTPMLLSFETACLTDLKVSFDFYFLRMKKGEKLELEYDETEKESWSLLKSWTKNGRKDPPLKNRTWYSAEVSLSVTNSSRLGVSIIALRFGTNSSKGKVFIDNLVIEGKYDHRG